ncbi:sensor domain-containing protein [Streptomyces tsukubensis]|uniref:sensor domain-containing protein n=1 Tax=Streptomyces tsukubensis TaxID=83656 RepID=UPI00344D1179
MQTAIVRRGAVAASAVSLALLLAACGGEDGTKDSKGEKAGGEGAKQSAPAKTQAELDKLIVAQTDLKGHSVKTPLPAELKDAKTATVDKDECAPLNEVLVIGAPGAEGALAARQTSRMPGEKPTSGTEDEKAEAALKALQGASVNLITLGSYADADAAGKAMADLKKSAESCASGFTSTVTTEKTKFAKVAPASYTGGDEALAYTVTADSPEGPMDAQLVVVRKGSEIFSVHSVSLSGKSEQPKDILEAQLKKLG